MNGKILFLEDDQDDVFLIRIACQDAGIKEPMKFLANGKLALDYLSAAVATPILPEVIFLDLNMPVMSGVEFLRWLREQPHLQRIPAVVLSTSENPRDVQAAYGAGANSYLMKPHAVSDLAAILRGATRFWMTGNEKLRY